WSAARCRDVRLQPHPSVTEPPSATVNTANSQMMPKGQRDHDLALSLPALGLVPRVEGRATGSKRASTLGTSLRAGRLSTRLAGWGQRNVAAACGRRSGCRWQSLAVHGAVLGRRRAELGAGGLDPSVLDAVAFLGQGLGQHLAGLLRLPLPVPQ